MLTQVFSWEYREILPGKAFVPASSDSQQLRIRQQRFSLKNLSSLQPKFIYFDSGTYAVGLWRVQVMVTKSNSLENRRRLAQLGVRLIVRVRGLERENYFCNFCSFLFVCFWPCCGGMRALRSLTRDPPALTVQRRVLTTGPPGTPLFH